MRYGVSRHFGNYRSHNFESPINLINNFEQLIENHVYKIKLFEHERFIYGVFRDNQNGVLRFYSSIGYPYSTPVPIYDQLNIDYTFISVDRIEHIWDTNIHYVMRGELYVDMLDPRLPFKSLGMTGFGSEEVMDGNYRTVGVHYYIIFLKEDGSEEATDLELIRSVDTATPFQKIMYPLNQIGVQLPVDGVYDLAEYLGKPPMNGGNKTRRKRQKRRKSKSMSRRK